MIKRLTESNILKWIIGLLIPIMMLFIGGFAGWVVHNLDEFPTKYVLAKEYDKDYNETNKKIECAIVDQKESQKELKQDVKELQTKIDEDLGEIRNYLLEIYRIMPKIDDE